MLQDVFSFCSLHILALSQDSGGIKAVEK